MENKELELSAKFHFERNEFSQAKQCFNQILDGYKIETNAHSDCLFNIASCLASEADFEAALDIFEQLQPSTSNDLLYSKALCHYMLNDYATALQLVDQLLDDCRQMLPEVALVSPRADTDEWPSQAITSSCLIEAINLRFAILYSQSKDQDGDFETNLTKALSFMGSLGALDCVSLHNQAISRHRLEPAPSVDKLTYLVDLGARDDSFASLVPSSALRNLIVLCANDSSFRKAGLKVYQEHKLQLVDTCPLEEVQLLEILLSKQAISEEDSYYWKLDQLSDKLLKQVHSEVDLSIDTTGLLSSVLSYQGLVLWQSNQYERLERLLSKFEPHLKTTHTWTINMANTLLMMDEKVDFATQLYESLMTTTTNLVSDNLLLIEPMILANLCVAYVLTGRNSEAEQLMKEVELDEAKLSERPERLHGLESEDVRNLRLYTTIINLVIGTLYCARNNYEFGLPKILKSLQPIEKKLQQNTWHHAKRCITWLLMLHCKQIIYLGDEIFDQLIGFLIECERYGVLVRAYNYNYDTDDNQASIYDGGEPFNANSTITCEARYLRSVILTMVHD